MNFCAENRSNYAWSNFCKQTADNQFLRSKQTAEGIKQKCKQTAEGIIQKCKRTAELSTQM